MGVPNPVINNQQNVKITNPEQELKYENRFAVTWKRFKKNKLAVTGLITFTIIVLIAIFAPLISPHSPTVSDIMDSNLGPSKKHPFGTDSMGGDVMSRAFYGSRVSLTVAILTMICSVSIGVLYGSVSGFFGGIVDNIMMRIVDALQSIPTFFLLLIVASLIVPTMWTTIFVLSIFGWTGLARVVRGEILSIKKRDFVEAARATGEKNKNIILHHVLPNAVAPIIVIATLDIAAVILSEAGLSFLGLGIQPPTPSWGNMLTSAQDLAVVLEYPWIAIFPGLFIIITVLSVNFIGDGLRDALDPRMKQ